MRRQKYIAYRSLVTVRDYNTLCRKPRLESSGFHRASFTSVAYIIPYSSGPCQAPKPQLLKFLSGTKDFAGLKAFASDYPEARRFMLYRGADRFLRDGVLCLPVEDFLRALDPASGLPA